LGVKFIILKSRENRLSKLHFVSWIQMQKKSFCYPNLILDKKPPKKFKIYYTMICFHYIFQQPRPHIKSKNNPNAFKKIQRVDENHPSCTVKWTSKVIRTPHKVYHPSFYHDFNFATRVCTSGEYFYSRMYITHESWKWWTLGVNAYSCSRSCYIVLV